MSSKHPGWGHQERPGRARKALLRRDLQQDEPPGGSRSNLTFPRRADRRNEQTIHSKAIFRYPPRALVPYLLREWLVYRPAQVYIARALRLHDVARALRYEAFPGLYRRLDSADLSDALRASTFKYLGYEVGLRYWRDIQVHFTQRFAEYEEGGESTQAIYAQRGHSREAGYRHYATPTDAPAGVPYGVMKAQLGASRFWQDLTGAGARAASRPSADQSLQV